jgi:hypothetical protein
MKPDVFFGVAIKSESGDDYGTQVFGFEPTDAELEKWCRRVFEAEFDDERDGPGRWGSCLHVEGPFELLPITREDL